MSDEQYRIKALIFRIRWYLISSSVQCGIGLKRNLGFKVFRSIQSHLGIANLSRYRLLWEKLVWQSVFIRYSLTHTHTRARWRCIHVHMFNASMLSLIDNYAKWKDWKTACSRPINRFCTHMRCCIILLLLLSRSSFTGTVKNIVFISILSDVRFWKLF